MNGPISFNMEDIGVWAEDGAIASGLTVALFLALRQPCAPDPIGGLTPASTGPNAFHTWLRCWAPVLPTDGWADERASDGFMLWGRRGASGPTPRGKVWDEMPCTPLLDNHSCIAWVISMRSYLGQHVVLISDTRTEWMCGSLCMRAIADVIWPWILVLWGLSVDNLDWSHPLDYVAQCSWLKSMHYVLYLRTQSTFFWSSLLLSSPFSLHRITSAGNYCSYYMQPT